MAYFHEFSLSLFISLSSSPSSSFVVEESFWDRLALHSIFESLFSCLFPKKMFVCVCVCVCVCQSTTLTFCISFLFLLLLSCLIQEFWNGRRAAISSPGSEVGLPRKQARLDDSSPSHINHKAGQVCLKRVLLSRSSDKSRSMSISKFMKNHQKRTRKVEEKSQCRDFSLKLRII